MALQRLAACLLWAMSLTGHRSAQALDPQAKRREAFIGYSERHRDIINLQTSHGQVGLLMCSPQSAQQQPHAACRYALHCCQTMPQGPWLPSRSWRWHPAAQVAASTAQRDHQRCRHDTQPACYAEAGLKLLTCCLQSGFGPPYGLLQGSLGGMKETPPLEGEMTARQALSSHSTLPTAFAVRAEALRLLCSRRGHACTIPGTAEFFIAAVDHPEWGHAHTVFGQVSDMQVVDAILEKEAYHDYINPDYGTLMRMLDSELPLNVVLAHNSQTLARTTT